MAKLGNVLNKIGSLYQSLTKSEKKIADTILRSPDLVSQCSLSEIAKHLQVGELRSSVFVEPLVLKVSASSN